MNFAFFWSVFVYFIRLLCDSLSLSCLLFSSCMCMCMEYFFSLFCLVLHWVSPVSTFYMHYHLYIEVNFFLEVKTSHNDILLLHISSFIFLLKRSHFFFDYSFRCFFPSCASSIHIFFLYKFYWCTYTHHCERIVENRKIAPYIWNS